MFAFLALGSLLSLLGAFAQPEILEAAVEQPVLKGFDFEAELTLAWPAGSFPKAGATAEPTLAVLRGS